MFGPIMDTCKVCKKEVEADLVAHGPGVCIIAYGCGHQMNASKDKTIWINTNTGKIDLEEVEGA